MDPKIIMKLLGRLSKGRAMQIMQIMQIMHEYYEPGADSGEAMLRHNGEERASSSGAGFN